MYDLFRYGDDVHSFLRSLCHGIRWNGENFVHSSEAELEDLQSELTDQQRTMRELIPAMSSLVEYLNFEGEESGMFENNRLPTMDKELWIDPLTGLLNHSFFEKKMCPNRVLQKTTALSEGSIRASLTQECIRRLKNYQTKRNKKSCQFLAKRW